MVDRLKDKIKQSPLSLQPSSYFKFQVKRLGDQTHDNLLAIPGVSSGSLKNFGHFSASLSDDGYVRIKPEILAER